MSIEISAWDYGIREEGVLDLFALMAWPTVRVGVTAVCAGPLWALPMVNEDDAWKFILKCQR